MRLPEPSTRYWLPHDARLASQRLTELDGRRHLLEGCKDDWRPETDPQVIAGLSEAERERFHVRSIEQHRITFRALLGFDYTAYEDVRSQLLLLTFDDRSPVYTVPPYGRGHRDQEPASY